LPAQDADGLQVVIGPDPPELERFVATELQRYPRMLFGPTVAVMDGVPEPEAPLVPVGGPDTDPKMAELG
jgi:hypothetical protein